MYSEHTYTFTQVRSVFNKKPVDGANGLRDGIEGCPHFRNGCFVEIPESLKFFDPIREGFDGERETS